MNIKLILTITVGFAIYSCNPGQDSRTSDEITGTYAREYSINVVHPETGKKVGMRTVRDTIFIRSVDSGYEVSNRKWRLNDYDKEGWRNMEHADDRPMSTLTVIYNQEDQTLSSNSSIVLYFDRQNQSVRKQSKKEHLFKKI